jgi:hypothetical protein
VDPNPLYRADYVSKLIPVLGLGAGATCAIGDMLSARVFADASALTRDMVIDIASDGAGRSPVWQTQRLMFSVSVSLVFGR